MRRPTQSPLARPPRGAISWVTLLLLIVAVTGSYLVRVWFPVYLLHYEVKAVVRDYLNQAVKNPADDVQKRKLCHKLRTLDEEQQIDENGRTVKVPVVQVAPEDVVWERDANAEPPTLRIAFEYTRTIHYPLLDRETEQTFSVDITQDVARPDWGPQR